MSSTHVLITLLSSINIFHSVLGLWVMVINATFNDIPVISWRSVLLVEETGVPGENHRPAASQTSSHNTVSSTPCLSRIRTHNVSGHRH
jgi:hypothetical protein